MKKLKGLSWSQALTVILNVVLSALTAIVLLVVALLMATTIVTSIKQPNKDYGYLPLQFIGICVALAGLFFGIGQKLFEELFDPRNEHLRIGMLYSVAAILVAVFAFTYPSYANIKSPYEVYSIPLYVVAGSLVAGVMAILTSLKKLTQ